MRFYLDKEDGNCLRDSEDGSVLCRTKREFQSLKNQIIKFEQLLEGKA